MKLHTWQVFNLWISLNSADFRHSLKVWSSKWTGYCVINNYYEHTFTFFYLHLQVNRRPMNWSGSCHEQIHEMSKPSPLFLLISIISGTPRFTWQSYPHGWPLHGGCHLNDWTQVLQLTLARGYTCQRCHSLTTLTSALCMGGACW